MVMRWLTRDLNGAGADELSDAVAAGQRAAYDRHRLAILPRLPDDLRTLAADPVHAPARSLHDGRLETWQADLPDRLVLSVICGDLQRGYERLRIEYRHAELVGTDEHRLAGWLADPQTEWLEHEVDALSDGRFEHRHLLWPSGEFAVRFAEISVTAAPATPKEYQDASRPASP
jgi:hypothetical protein